jgi:hypothetical protein
MKGVTKSMSTESSSGDPSLTSDARYSGPPAVRCSQYGKSTGLHIDSVEVHSAGGQTLSATTQGEDAGARIQLQLADGADDPEKRHRIVLLS